MTQPDRIEFKVGETVHKQQIRLIGERKGNDAYIWTLHQDQACQRDESNSIYNIPADVFLKIAEAIKGVK